MADQPLSGQSNDPGVPGVRGENTTTGQNPNADGVVGVCHSNLGAGVHGESVEGRGVYGHSEITEGVVGESAANHGLFGRTKSALHAGIAGVNTNTHGPINLSLPAPGVWGSSEIGEGVVGESTQFDGVLGRSQSPQHAGVSGLNMTSGFGVLGRSEGGEGIHGESNSMTWAGVAGIQKNPQGAAPGVWGSSEGGEGIHGESNSKDWVGVAGLQINPDSTAAGVWAESKGKGPGLFARSDKGNAGDFEGDVRVTGKILAHDVYLTSGDCAEEFPVADNAETGPGTVVVFEEGGILEHCSRPYDRRVAGVIAGGGGRRPAIVLGRDGSVGRRAPLALLGRVLCKVDASTQPIRVGDLLTTSTVAGHAMCADPKLAAGSILGKALERLDAGVGLIPILVCIQ